jgi:dethiobiotin synthetase
MIVLVAGTGTDIGKTWVTAATARVLRDRGHSVRAYKPAQSFEPGDDDAGRTDAHALSLATAQTPDDVCPRARWFPVAMAPPMAADVLDLAPFTIADLAAGLGDDDRDFVFVESAGGVRSPIATNGDTVDLAGACAADLVVLVADAGLGTISAVRLAVGALAEATPSDAVIVHLNRFDDRDDLHRRNRDWLRARDGLEIVTDPEALASRLEAARDDAAPPIR